MSKYYLIPGLILEISNFSKIHGFDKKPTIEEKVKIYEKIFEKNTHNKFTFPPPKNYTFLKLSKTEEIKVVYFDCYTGNFLIKADSRESAYNIMNIIFGFHLLYSHVCIEPDISIYRLWEINKIPNYSWTVEDVINALDKRIHSWYDEEESFKLTSSFDIFESTFDELKLFIKCFYNDDDSREALEHLMQSAQVFGYFPNSNYYRSHYSHDVKLNNKLVYIKKYLEDKITYETAFLAAFKGIERFFRVTQVF